MAIIQGATPARKIVLATSAVMMATACGWPGLHELAFPLAATWMMLWLLLMRRECSTISDISTTLMGLFYTAYGRPRPNDAAAGRGGRLVDNSVEARRAAVAGAT